MAITDPYEGYSTSLYVLEPGDGTSIEPTDIHQAEIPDCWFLSAMAEIALKNPNFITNRLITDNGDGTETVNLYANGRGLSLGSSLEWYENGSGDLIKPPTQKFSADPITVDDTFAEDAVNSLNATDVVNGVKEIWPQVVEKAYGEYLGSFPDGGAPGVALEALTGHQAYTQPIDTVRAKEITGLENHGSLLMLASNYTGDLAYGLVNNHCYAVEGVIHQNGQMMLSLYNPWGTSQPSPIPFSELKNNFIDLDHGPI